MTNAVSPVTQPVDETPEARKVRVRLENSILLGLIATCGEYDTDWLFVGEYLVKVRREGWLRGPVMLAFVTTCPYADIVAKFYRLTNYQLPKSHQKAAPEIAVEAVPAAEVVVKTPRAPLAADATSGKKKAKKGKKRNASKPNQKPDAAPAAGKTTSDVTADAPSGGATNGSTKRPQRRKVAIPDGVIERLTANTPPADATISRVAAKGGKPEGAVMHGSFGGLDRVMETLRAQQADDAVETVADLPADQPVIDLAVVASTADAPVEQASA